MILSSLVARARAAYHALTGPVASQLDGSPPVGRGSVAATGAASDAVDETEANEAARLLYEAARANDPFPEIESALLNSAHIEDYAIATAMVHPFESGRRKSASYPLRIGGMLAFGDPDAKPFALPCRPLAPLEQFTLPPNSLVYVQTKELFQLPNYIAVRFNLHIELVHKGLLLGTGPLVDPGFRGRLVIPLHNMTSNEYVLAEDDDIIWAEFTKTSVDPAWRRHADEQEASRPRPRATFAAFSSDKSNLTMNDYFAKALRPHRGEDRALPYEFPANATPAVIADAGRKAAKAETDAAAAGRSASEAAGQAGRIANFGILTIIAVGIALITLILVVLQMVQTTTTMTKDAVAETTRLDGRLSDYQRSLADRDERLASAALSDLCSSSVSGGDADRLRLEMSGRANAAEEAATASAKAAGLLNPFPTRVPVAAARPTDEICRTK